MKKTVYLVLVIFVLFFVSVLPAKAHSHGHSSFRGSVWIGPGWGWEPWWWGGPAYPYYYDYWRPPVTIEEQPPVYVEPTPQPEKRNYWYYCPDARNYYPYVKQCPNGWLKVVPPPAPPDLNAPAAPSPRY